MPFFCEIDNKLNFNIEIMVDSELLEQDLSQLFKNTIVIATNINKQYDYFMSKEGKILGQERIQLVESLDNMFVLLVIMRIRLKKNISMDAALIKELNFKVPINVKYNKFTIQGKLTKDDLFEMQSFKKGYSVLIFNKIKEILIKYKSVLNGKGVLNDRLLELYRTFDGILYNSIVIRYKLENCLIDR